MASEKQLVLIVEDQAINRQILRRILETEYVVLEAENGRAALELLEQERGVAAVLLDIVMPEMDGYAFLRALKSTPAASVPVIAVTTESGGEAEQTALELGAWDFITKPYQPRVLLTRLKNVIVRSQFYLLSEMKHLYEHDALTGLFNRRAFFDGTRKLLDGNPDRRFALCRLDIDNFHLLNSFWGEEAGDRFLCFVADGLRALDREVHPCIYARINADVFAVCIPYDPGRIRQRIDQASEALANYNRNYLIEPSVGVYVIDDPSEKVEAMFERATLAARQCKNRYLCRLNYYRPEMSRRLLEEQRIVNEMQHALDDEQFQVYLQPKYNLDSGQPYGAEALIRWQHPELGLLSPGAFIPVFERNGFIGRVDEYMWERVCRLLRKWMDEGQEPAPVSVNVSRVNLYNPNLVRRITELTEAYRVPPHLLNLELTESVYMENPDLMEKTVAALQAAGFIVMMDDFGSGYSSLNTLKDIRVDVLKIDMKFLAGGSDSNRSECILASVIRMAGWLETPVIMEGVETRTQVDFLKSIGCGYVQGYFFAKPMPVPAYEALIRSADQQPARSLSANSRAMREIIWSSSPQIDLLFNSIRRPAAIYEFENGRFRALRVNAGFNDFFGYGGQAGSSSEGAAACLSPAELSRLLGAFRAAAETESSVLCDYSLADGGAAHLVHLDLQYWGRNEKATILFALFS